MVATLCEHDLQMLCDEIGISSSEFAEQTSLKKRVLVVVTTAIRQGLFVRLIAVLAKSWPYAFSESRVMLEHLVALATWRFRRGWDLLEQQILDHTPAWTDAEEAFRALVTVGATASFRGAALGEALLAVANTRVQASGRWDLFATALGVFLPHCADVPELGQLVGQLERVKRVAADTRVALERRDWSGAESALKEYVLFAAHPDLAPIVARIQDAQRLVHECEEAAAAQLWDTAYARIDALHDKHPGYPVPARLEAIVNEPRRIIDQARGAIRRRCWSAALSLREPLARLTMHREARELVATLERAQQSHDEVLAQIERADWPAVIAALERMDADYPEYPRELPAPAVVKAALARRAELLAAALSPDLSECEARLAAARELLATLPCDPETAARVAALERAAAELRRVEDAESAGDFRAAAEACLRLAADGIPGAATRAATLAEVADLQGIARAAILEGHPDAAEAALSRIAGIVDADRECRPHLERARALARETRWLRIGMLRDPALQRWRPDAYEILARTGAVSGPDFGLDVLLNAGVEPGRGPYNAAERHAHDELCNVEARLVVDADYYPLHNGEELLAALVADLAPGPILRPSGAEQARAAVGPPEDVAAFHLLRGERGQALASWRARQARTPRDAEVAWSIHLCHVAAAVAAEQRSDFDAAFAAWRAAIPGFAIAITDATHWRVWSWARGKVYGRPVLAHATEAAVRQLSVRFIADLERFGERRRSHRADAPRTEDLALDAFVEQRAVELVRKAGGLATPQGGKLWAGPLFLAASGQDRLAGDLCAEFTVGTRSHVLAVSDEVDLVDFARRLRLYFSSLRYAAGHLEQEQPNPAGVLRELASRPSGPELAAGPDPASRLSAPALSRPRCTACPIACATPECPRHALSRWTAGVCCVACPRFADNNPAYLAVPSPASRYRADVAWLAASALFLRGRQALEPEPGAHANEVASTWQAALELAAVHDGAAALAEQMACIVDKLASPEHPELRVDLLAMLHATSVGRGLVAARYTAALTKLGAHQCELGDHEAANRSLEAAFGLHEPVADHVRDAYAVVLIRLAHDVARDDGERSAALKSRARALLDEGLRRNPDYDEYRRTLKMLEQFRGPPDAAALAAMLDEAKASLVTSTPGVRRRAVDLRDAGHNSEALAVYEELAQAACDDAHLRDEILDTLAREVTRADAEGRPGDGARLLVQWRERCGDAPDFDARWRFHRWSQHVREALVAWEFRFTMGRGIFALSFPAEAFGVLTVEVHVEERGVGLTSMVTRGNVDEEQLLGQLLQITGALPHYRVSPLDGGNYAFSSRIATAGEPEATPRAFGHKLNVLLHGHSALGDLAPATIPRLDRLRQHVERVRQKLSATYPACTEGDLEALSSHLTHRGEWTPRTIEEQQIRLDGRLDGCDVSVELHADLLGLRLTLPLGYLRGGADRLDTLRALSRANARLSAGKLTLAEDGVVRLSAEALDVDLATLAAAEEFLRANMDGLRREFVEPDGPVR